MAAACRVLVLARGNLPCRVHRVACGNLACGNLWRHVPTWRGVPCADVTCCAVCQLGASIVCALAGCRPSGKTQVGFTELERWLCFSAVKNNLADAAAKAKAGPPPSPTPPRVFPLLACSCLPYCGALAFSIGMHSPSLLLVASAPRAASIACVGARVCC